MNGFSVGDMVRYQGKVYQIAERYKCSVLLTWMVKLDGHAVGVSEKYLERV